MKSKAGLLIGLCTLVFSSLSSAATLFTFSGSISSLYQGTTLDAASSELQAHYAAIGVGQSVQFQVLVDFSRQGQKTNADGSITVFNDVPLTRNCDTCYGYSGVQNDYAELVASSVDFSTSSTAVGQTYMNLASSVYSSGMATNSHAGTISVGPLVLESFLGGGDYNLIYNWQVSTWPRYFNFVFNDGAGLVHAYGQGQLIAVTNVVPIPASTWLMGSSLLTLAGIGRRRK